MMMRMHGRMEEEETEERMARMMRMMEFVGWSSVLLLDHSAPGYKECNYHIHNWTGQSHRCDGIW